MEQEIFHFGVSVICASRNLLRKGGGGYNLNSGTQRGKFFGKNGTFKLQKVHSSEFGFRIFKVSSLECRGYEDLGKNFQFFLAHKEL